MTSPHAPTAPTRSRADTGWRRAGLLGLMLVAFVWMPVGARDAAGVSAVLPALRAVSLAQPVGTSIVRAAPAADDSTRAPRPAPVAAVAVALLLVAALALARLHRGHVATDAPRPVTVTSLGSRGPPLVH